MGDKGGSSQPRCKWHLRQQSEGVCAICLRKSLEKLAAYQGEYQESINTYPGAFSSNPVAEFSRERDSSAQSFQPTYSSVSYRTRSEKEPKPKGGFTSQDASISDSRKPKDATSSKDKYWGVAVHRIASLRSAFTSLWKSNKQPQVKRKQNTGVRDEHCGKLYGQNGTEEERKELYEQQYAANCQTGRVNGDSKRNSTSCGKTIPWTGSSSFASKFTHRSSTLEDSQTQWRRSKSSRESKSEPHVHVPTDYRPRIPDGDRAYDAPSPIQPVPHPSSKSSPWTNFSRSGSRHSPHGGFKPETPKTTPKGSTASVCRQYLTMASDSRSSPLSCGFSSISGSADSIFKSAITSPSMVKPNPPFHISLGSKSTSWSRTLSPSSSKPSPLYLAPRTIKIKRHSLSRDSIDAQGVLDQSNPVDVHSLRGTRLSMDGVQDSLSHLYEDSTLSVPSNPFMQDPVTVQKKTDSLSIISVIGKVDWPRVMSGQATTAPLVQTPRATARGT